MKFKKSTKRNCAKREFDLTWNIIGRIWISNEADDIHLRFLVVAHCGAAGHRWDETTENDLCEQLTSDTPKEDV